MSDEPPAVGSRRPAAATVKAKTALVRAKLAALAELAPEAAQPGRRWTADELATFEAQHGLVMPADYRAVLLEIGDGGVGLLVRSLGQSASRMNALRDMSATVLADLGSPFPLTTQHRVTEPKPELSHGCLPMAEADDGNDILLVVNTTVATLHGSVWFDATFYDPEDGGGLLPVRGSLLDLVIAWLDSQIAEATPVGATELSAAPPERRLELLSQPDVVAVLADSRLGAGFAVDALDRLAAADRDPRKLRAVADAIIEREAGRPPVEPFDGALCAVAVHIARAAAGYAFDELTGYLRSLVHDVRRDRPAPGIPRLVELLDATARVPDHVWRGLQFVVEECCRRGHVDDALLLLGAVARHPDSAKRQRDEYLRLAAPVLAASHPAGDGEVGPGGVLPADAVALIEQPRSTPQLIEELIARGWVTTAEWLATNLASRPKRHRDDSDWLLAETPQLLVMLVVQDELDRAGRCARRVRRLVNGRWSHWRPLYDAVIALSAGDLAKADHDLATVHQWPAVLALRSWAALRAGNRQQADEAAAVLAEASPPAQPPAVVDQYIDGTLALALAFTGQWPAVISLTAGADPSAAYAAERDTGWWHLHGYALWYLATLVHDPRTLDGREPPKLSHLYRTYERALYALASRQEPRVANHPAFVQR
jgi:hypothetical protein